MPWAAVIKQKARPLSRRTGLFLIGRGDRIRTYDFQLPKLTLYQTELRPATPTNLKKTSDMEYGLPESGYAFQATRRSPAVLRWSGTCVVVWAAWLPVVDSALRTRPS